MFLILPHQCCYLPECFGHYLQLLPILKNLRDLLRYSWGTTALSHMYYDLHVACIGGSRICSCLFVLDVCVFSCLHLTILLPLNVLTFALGRFGLMSSECFLTLLLTIYAPLALDLEDFWLDREPHGGTRFSEWVSL